VEYARLSPQVLQTQDAPVFITGATAPEPVRRHKALNVCPICIGACTAEITAPWTGILVVRGAAARPMHVPLFMEIATPTTINAGAHGGLMIRTN
jgi:hypothetical protein